MPRETEHTMKTFNVTRAEATETLNHWLAERKRFGDPAAGADLARPMNYREIIAAQVRSWRRFLGGEPVVQMDGAVARVA